MVNILGKIFSKKLKKAIEKKIVEIFRTSLDDLTDSINNMGLEFAFKRAH
jgi:hypothetical protein